ncbi:MAG: hypothetical protein ABT11_12025 [Novosphingobium sp. SCN 66-18]|nr:MAG: hypothetical protein ABT11_12025 [Novosphingobium sp. SCN 66-18]
MPLMTTAIIALLLTPAFLAKALVALSMLVVALFGILKWKARARRSRISEGTFVHLAFLRGTLGASLWSSLFRHKTHTELLPRVLHVNPFLPVTALAGWKVWALAKPLPP